MAKSYPQVTSNEAVAASFLNITTIQGTRRITIIADVAFYFHGALDDATGATNRFPVAANQALSNVQVIGGTTVKLTAQSGNLAKVWWMEEQEYA